MQHFQLQRSLPSWGKNTYVNWATRDVQKAIVFIHGFSGSSLATFGNFNLEFRYKPEYYDYDVYFYGYDSLKIQTTVSGDAFYSFLETLYDQLGSVVTDSGLEVSRSRGYKEIVIIAHSLGAVVARYALLIGAKSKATWLDQCKLILFAPAHKGAKKAVKFYSQLPGLLKYVGPFADYFVVTINEVIEGSELIQDLEEKYRAILAKKTRRFAIATKVVWAEKERVVNNYDFLQDPRAEVMKQKDHTSVCKPTSSFTRPFAIVKTVLSQNP